MAWRFHAMDAVFSPWTREVLLVDVFYSGVGEGVGYIHRKDASVQFRIQPVLQPNGAPFWSPILLIMSMTVAMTPTIAMMIVTGTSAFIDAASRPTRVCQVRCKEKPVLQWQKFALQPDP